MEIIFALTRYVYDSYQDYRALVAASGFPTCFVDEIDRSREAIYIFTPMNGEVRPHLRNHQDKPKRNKVIWWMLERPGSNPGNVINQFVESNKNDLNDCIDHIWFSDKWIADKHNHPRVHFVPMGSHPDLHKGPKAWEIWGGNKTHSMIHTSYITNRRDIAYQRIIKQGGITVHPNCWGDERDKALRNTKFMVNVHQDGHLMFEPLRVAVAAAAGIPLISEEWWSSYPLMPNTHFINSKYGELHRVFMKHHMEDYRPLAAMGKRLHDHLCGTYRFDKNVREFCEKQGWT